MGCKIGSYVIPVLVKLQFVKLIIILSLFCHSLCIIACTLAPSLPSPGQGLVSGNLMFLFAYISTGYNSSRLFHSRISCCYDTVRLIPAGGGIRSWFPNGSSYHTPRPSDGSMTLTTLHLSFFPFARD